MFAFCHQSCIISIFEVIAILPATSIPACDSSSLAFSMMYSEYELNKQGDSISLDVLLSQFWPSVLFHVWF